MPRKFIGRSQTALFLLPLTLATVFLFGRDRVHFCRDSSATWDSVKNLTLVKNLSSVHSFRLFIRCHLLADGTPAYEMYSRFPVGGYALIKLATIPFDGFGGQNRHPAADAAVAQCSGGVGIRGSPG